MTARVPFFDGHNDFLLRLTMTPVPREETWLGAGGGGTLTSRGCRRPGSRADSSRSS